jgi:hypothetical protein
LAYASFKVREIINSAVSHEWSVPEFQRGFVWKATQVRDLAESLWRDYPVGSLLIWDSREQTDKVEQRGAGDARAPTNWLVDGQQRATALCILAGRRPYWWPSGASWNDYLKRYDIRFDIEAVDPPFFLVANAVTRKNPSRYLPVSELIGLNLEPDADQQKLIDTARSTKKAGHCAHLDAMEIKTRLERIARIGGREIVGITVAHDLEEVVEIFARLNGKGTRVKEADIYLGVVAARAPGWVRDHFLPFVDDMAAQGFDVTPNLLFQCLTAVGAQRVRFKQVDDSFRGASNIQPAWYRTKSAWRQVVRFLERYGVLSNALMPSDAVFVTLCAFFDRFPTARPEPLMEWLIQALRYGRYSGSSVTSLDEDLKEVESATDEHSAVTGLRRRIRAISDFEKEEFLRDFADTRFGRFMLYLLVFDRGAVDWDETGDRIAFQKGELERGYAPQFHHVFPRAFLAGKAPQEKVEALANIAIIGPSANIRISAQDPLAYFEKYGISRDMREQQLICGDVAALTTDAFPQWLDQRSGLLTDASNSFVQRLIGEGLKD